MSSIGINLDPYKFSINLDPFNPLSTNFTKWSNTLKQFVGKLPTNCLGVFNHFVGFELKGLRKDRDRPHFHICF